MLIYLRLVFDQDDLMLRLAIRQTPEQMILLRVLRPRRRPGQPSLDSQLRATVRELVRETGQTSINIFSFLKLLHITLSYIIII